MQLDTLPPEGIEAYELPPHFRTKAPNDLLIVASFGHLIPPSLLSRFPPAQRLNLHPSMLPELSGAAPIQWAIAKQKDKTGVTVQTLGEKFDSGDILSQEEVVSNLLGAEVALADCNVPGHGPDSEIPKDGKDSGRAWRPAAHQDAS